jgi:hypothetical protein
MINHRRQFVIFNVMCLSMALAAGVLGQARASGNDGRNKPRFTFALWGDAMYSAADFSKLAALTADINASKAAFSIYDGDIKSGSTQCTNDVYGRAIDLFNAFEAPMIYVPGDNEWTDCHRINNGGYNNLERLAFLRQTMFATQDSFGQRTLPLEHQGPLGGEYAENTRWSYGDVVFVALNVPGSNNNKVNGADCANKSVRTPADCAADNVEYLARDAANIEFLRSTFALAKTTGALGLVVIMQADPSFDLPETEDVNERTCVRVASGQCLPAPADPTRAGYDGYTAFLAALTAETSDFAGKVVLVHGDTHFFKVDQPLINQASLLPNFTRVQTYGSPNINWVQVTVEPKDRALFTFQPMIVE